MSFLALNCGIVSCQKSVGTDPLNDDGTSVGWADVADLNYDSEGLRKAMIEDMLYWITEEGIDGFRCDVAGSVPTDFWQKTLIDDSYHTLVLNKLKAFQVQRNLVLT